MKGDPFACVWLSPLEWPGNWIIQEGSGSGLDFVICIYLPIGDVLAVGLCTCAAKTGREIGREWWTMDEGEGTAAGLRRAQGIARLHEREIAKWGCVYMRQTPEAVGRLVAGLASRSDIP